VKTSRISKQALRDGYVKADFHLKFSLSELHRPTDGRIICRHWANMSGYILLGRSNSELVWETICLSTESLIAATSMHIHFEGRNFWRRLASVAEARRSKNRRRRPIVGEGFLGRSSEPPHQLGGHGSAVSSPAGRLWT